MGKHVTRSTLMTTIRQIIYDARLRSHMSSPSPLSSPSSPLLRRPETEGRVTTTITTPTAKRKEVIHGLKILRYYYTGGCPENDLIRFFDYPRTFDIILAVAESKRSSICFVQDGVVVPGAVQVPHE
jgi:hypothetical protein